MFKRNLNQQHRYVDIIVVYLVMALLSMVAVSKIVILGLGFRSKLLQEGNPLLDALPNWLMTVFAILIELSVVFFLIKNRKDSRKAGICLIWLSTLFGTYRLGLWLVSPQSSCGCLGILGVFIRSGSIRENHISLLLLICLFVSGVYLLLRGRSSLLLEKTTFTGCLALFAWAVFQPDAAHAATWKVKIEGNIDYKYLNKDGKQINSSFSHFVVCRDSRGWLLTAKQPPSDVYSIGYDGTSTFSLIASTNESRKIDSAIIDPVSFPIATGAENIPWWFFCFSKEIDAKVQDIPTPWGNPRGDFQALFCTRVVGWSTNYPYLIKSVDFYYSSNKVMSSFNSPIINRQSESGISHSMIKRLAENIDGKRLLAGRCAVMSWTNTNFGVFPNRFQTLVFSSLSEQENGEGEVVRISCDGEVTNICALREMDYEPHLDREISTVDFRFSDPQKGVASLQYGPQSHWSLNVSDVDTSKAKVIRNVPVSDPENHQKIRFLVLLFLIITAFFPIVLWAGLKMGKANKKQTTNKL